MSLTRILPLLFAAVWMPAALALPIVSGDGTEQCRMASGAACNVQTISVHEKWQTNNPNGLGAEWISYADTGAAGSTLAVAPGGDVTNPLMLVREVLLDITAGARLVMDLWADDTAQVDLRYDDGSDFSGGLLRRLFDADFSQNICADGPTGCEPDDVAKIDYTFTEDDLVIAGGASIWLHFTTFQVGTGTTNATNPFGLLYSGTLALADSAVPVPEPPAWALMAGIGLFGLVVLRRRQAS